MVRKTLISVDQNNGTNTTEYPLLGLQAGEKRLFTELILSTIAMERLVEWLNGIFVAISLDDWKRGSIVFV